MCYMGPDLPWEGAILRGKGLPIEKYRVHRLCAAAMRPFVKLLRPLVIAFATKAVASDSALSSRSELTVRFTDRRTTATVAGSRQ